MAANFFELIGSPHRELVKSPHHELNPGTTGVSRLHCTVSAPGWAPFTFPGPGWPWTGITVGVLTYTSISYTATAANGPTTLSASMSLDRRNQMPTGDGWTHGPFGPPSQGVTDCNILWGLLSNSLGEGIYTTTPTSVTYDESNLGVESRGSASVTLSAPFTLQDLYDDAHFLFGQINIESVPRDNDWDVVYQPGLAATAFPQITAGQIFVPTLFQTEIDVYYWGWGVPSFNTIVPPQAVPVPFAPINPLPPLVTATSVHLTGDDLIAQSKYTGGQWEMNKSIWRKPGQSAVGIEQDFEATIPGPPREATPTNLVLPCDPNGTFILTPSGTAIDIKADTGNNNYRGIRFRNGMP